MQGGSTLLEANPNPAPEGGSVTVSGPPNSTVKWKPDGPADWVELPLGPDGDATIPVPAGTRGITVTDGGRPRSRTVYVEVYGTS